MKKEPIDIDTSKNAQLNKGESGVPLTVPVSIVRWLIYSICFFVFLTPFEHTIGQWICSAVIIGWFASQLNGIANKK